jgi:hypothetical protein
VTTEEKIKHIQSYMSLIAFATTYRDALSHSCFLRGMLRAWRLDGSIAEETYNNHQNKIEHIMIEKRKLPVKGDVV